MHLLILINSDVANIKPTRLSGCYWWWCLSGLQILFIYCCLLGYQYHREPLEEPDGNTPISHFSLSFCYRELWKDLFGCSWCLDVNLAIINVPITFRTIKCNIICMEITQHSCNNCKMFLLSFSFCMKLSAIVLLTLRIAW